MNGNVHAWRQLFTDFRGQAVFLLASLDHKGRVYNESDRHEIWWNIGWKH